jgi:pimeloyl-ACP methyl ester carboxylesterase
MHEDNAMSAGSAGLQEGALRRCVIALHCSGSGASQWTHLADTLGDGYELLAPEHYGNESAGAWGGDHAFTLADEAERTLGVIQRETGKVHLVGHSYGGGVALTAALAAPERIASLVLYEPSAFHLLQLMGSAGADAFAEIAGVARLISYGVITGDYRGAMERFVDYWSTPGSFRRMRPEVQDRLIAWAPKAPLDFHALIDNPLSEDAYATLDVPTLILCGEHAPRPTRTIAYRLAELLLQGRVRVVAGAGHLGPITHPDVVSPLMVQHIRMAGTDRYRQAPLQFHARARQQMEAMS